MVCPSSLQSSQAFFSSPGPESQYCRGVGSTDTLIRQGGARKLLRSSYYELLILKLKLRKTASNKFIRYAVNVNSVHLLTVDIQQQQVVQPALTNRTVQIEVQISLQTPHR